MPLYEIGGHVRFLGWRYDAAALIAQLDVYCTASMQSHCSLSVLEADDVVGYRGHIADEHVPGDRVW